VFDWILSVMSAAGYLGLAFLMLVENVFPPIPSEVVMPLGGFLAARGELSIVGVVLAGTIGSVAGATFWYWIGIAVGEKRLRVLAARHGRWFTVAPEDIDRAADWFRRHGAMAVFFGRMMPGLRTLISVPAGVARMPLLPFLAYTTAGSLLWIGALAWLGYVLESQYDRVAAWLDPATWVIIGAIVAAYVWRLVRQEVRR
jgi:membrane protein DedA with SNARE-associated domain